MSQDIEDVWTCGFVGSGVLWSFAGGAGWSSGALIVPGGVEGEFSQDFAGGGVDDADVEVLDEDQDVGSGVGSPDSDVVESAGVPQGDGAGFGDSVGADAVVGFGAADAERRTALDQAIVGLAAAFLRDGEMRWEFLLYTARRTAGTSQPDHL
jgi:hypothetical protein